jgi:bacillithiol biosynthesis deacetylase BshB1
MNANNYFYVLKNTLIMTHKVHILAFGAHPDDVELSCSGTLISHVIAGYPVAVADLTRGELGTRGTVATREKEAAEAAKIMGIQHRENLGFKDGFFKNDEEHQRAIVRIIRKYQPEYILCNAVHDRHPDHGRGSSLISDSCFLSMLRKVETKDDQGNEQPIWKPKAVYHYIQDRYIHPSFVVDISGHVEQKLACIRAYKTQFYDPASSEPETYISSPAFLESVIGRDAMFGKTIGTTHAEGFTSERLFGVKKFNDLL